MKKRSRDEGAAGYLLVKKAAGRCVGKKSCDEGAAG
jgi:hypothetical protein